MNGAASLTSVRDAVRTRQVAAAEVVRAAVEEMERTGPKLNAFISRFGERAVEAGKRVDERIARGEGDNLPLAGVPIAVKDNMCFGPDVEGGGGRTTAGSRILENYESPYTATAVRRLVEAGAVIVGKTNLDEFAMGSSGENSAFGPTRNPWDVSRVPGGSSAGSAAAVAAGVVPAALGSDTGGSIRQPAGFCGLVGVKPTYGRVSRYGLIAFASSLDQIGPLTRNVGDAAAVLDVICGRDEMDSTSADHEPPQCSCDLEKPVEALVLGVPKQAFNAANHPGVLAALERAIKVYTKLGARIVEVDLPHIEHGIAAYYIVAPAEASSNLARFDGIRYGRRATLGAGEGLFDLYCKSRGEGFGAEVQRRIMLGTYVLSAGYYDAYYTTALKVRRKIKGDYDAAFSENGGGCHALLMPSSPGPAFKIGSKTSDPLAMYLEDVYTVGVNLAGLPGVVLPGGFAEKEGKKLPVGVQLVGPAWEESRLLRVARMLERETEAVGMPTV